MKQLKIPIKKVVNKKTREKVSVENPKKNNTELADEKMRITMLGTSSSGKTAFLSGIYQSMIEDYDTDLHLKVNPQYGGQESYASIQDIAIGSHFATGTRETKRYGLILCGDKEPYCEFEFLDYRGGLVNDLRPGMQPQKNNPDTIKELREQLIQSDCILIFMDAIKISQYEDVQQRKQYSEISLINYIFDNVLQPEKKKHHVIVVLTKTDDSFVKPEDKENHYQRLCEKALEICHVIRRRSYSFEIIPVSAVGEGKTVTTEKKDENGVTTWESEMKSGAIPEPMNIDLVMLRACSLILEERERMLQEEIEKLEMFYRDAGQKNTILRRRTLEEAWAEQGRKIREKESVQNKLRNSILNMQEKKLDKLQKYVYYEEKKSEKKYEI